jgi:hypothetical protein
VRCLLFTFVLLAGCGYWGTRPIVRPTPVDPRAPAWIWSGGEVMKWHALVVTQDSVSGIPYEQFEYCRSCRRTLPRSRVDSMKVGFHTIPQKVTRTVGIATVVIVADALVEGALCYLVGPSACEQ